MTTQTYRPDIDFLRFVAVTMVVLFHAGYKKFSGGFIGVDVFFVISGYLIFNTININNFSVIHFFQKRFFRLIPTLFIVVISILCISYFILLPDIFQLAGKTARYSSVFMVNYMLIEDNLGYFQRWLTKKNVFLHLWSLSIEEQFYLSLPLVIYLKTKFQIKENLLNFFFVIVTFSGFLYSHYLSTQGNANAYYSFFSRSWEICFGVLLAINSVKLPSISPRLSNLLYIILLSSLFYCCLSFTTKTAFPGINALLIVLLTSGLIVLGTNINGILKQIICNKLFIQIGLISYSLYLWHWPIMSLNEQSFLFSFSRFETILISLFVSFLSWKFIEIPFRGINLDKEKYLKPIIVLSSISGLYLISSFYEMSNRDFYFKYFNKTYTKDMFPISDNYPYRKWQYPKVKRWGAEGITKTILLGDSFGSMWGPGLDSEFKQNNIGALNFTQQGCLFIEMLSSNKQCEKLKSKIKQVLKEQKPENVVLFGRWENLFRKDIYPNNTSEEITKHNIIAGFDKTVHFLKKHVKRVYIVIAPVEPGDPSPYLKRLQLTGEDQFMPKNLSIINKGPHQTLILEYFETLYKQDLVVLIDPNKHLCPRDKCFVSYNKKILFHDGSHLNKYGSAYLVDSFSLLIGN